MVYDAVDDLFSFFFQRFVAVKESEFQVVRFNSASKMQHLHWTPKWPLEGRNQTSWSVVICQCQNAKSLPYFSEEEPFQHENTFQKNLKQSEQTLQKTPQDATFLRKNIRQSHQGFSRRGRAGHCVCLWPKRRHRGPTSHETFGGRGWPVGQMARYGQVVFRFFHFCFVTNCRVNSNKLEWPLRGVISARCCLLIGIGLFHDFSVFSSRRLRRRCFWISRR